ncbi:MAG TPA: amino acid permease [Gemmatimonadales bacterium]|nr:amino acid permease [Gemmatimonadales bacterium]
MTRTPSGDHRETSPAGDARLIHDDLETLHRLGYAQELLRRMHGFSNFAISFSIICILAGGITSFPVGLASVGGAAIGLGWPIGACFSFIVALGMAQIGSAFPTAGGLYHWGSILGGRGWGWLTAWFNLIGLVTVMAAVNVGTYGLFVGFFGPALHFDPSAHPILWQTVCVVVVTTTQALFNHLGIRVTTRLTDFSGYLIFGVAAALTALLLAFAPSHDWSRLWTFTNLSGAAGGDVWPHSSSLAYLFLVSLLLPAYTITGFDASAHTAEETIDAARSVPRGMIRAVVYSALFGYCMLIAMVVAIPDLRTAAARGWNLFFYLMETVLPGGLRLTLYAGIWIANYLCGLAIVTSASRMVFAFARDGGLPFSDRLRRVSPRFRTPPAAIWVAAILGVLFAVYTPVYSTIVVVCVVFLYVSYVLPIAAGLVAYGRTWTRMGPWTIGSWFRPVAAVAVLGCVGIIFIGVQPPNEKALTVLIASLAVTALVWFGFERRRFQGPPVGALTLERQAVLLAAERAVGQALEG